MNNRLVNLLEFEKYPKIPYVDNSSNLYGKEVYIFEKIDGSLSQIRRTNEGIFGGSKANYITGSTKRPEWGSKFLKWMHSNPSLYNLKPGTIMFGEWLDPVTIDYDEEFYDNFYFLDLAIIDGGNIVFYDYYESLNYLDKWGIKNVNTLPVIAKKYFDESVARDIVMNQPSYLRTEKRDSEGNLINCELEGVVLKNYRLQSFAKYLHPKYSEIRAQEKELDKKYLTDLRVKKAVRRLKDHGFKDPSLEELVYEVIQDIRSETGVSFSRSAVKGAIRARSLYHNKDH